MRIRLSGKIPVVEKIHVAFLIFFFLSTVSAVLLMSIGFRIPVWYVLVATYFIASYPLSQYLYKDRIVVSFNLENFYITNVNSGTEEVIPLSHATHLNTRIPEIRKDSIWSWKYRLYYLDNFNNDQNVRLFINQRSIEFREFITFAKMKSPNFRIIHYSKWFDLRD
jgi:hypothetical protein